MNFICFSNNSLYDLKQHDEKPKIATIYQKESLQNIENTSALSSKETVAQSGNDVFNENSVDGNIETTMTTTQNPIKNQEIKNESNLRKC